MTYSITPWLSVNDSKAVDFYKLAFDAKEVYRMDDPGGGVVVRLSVHGAEFWVSADPSGPSTSVASSNHSIKMILVVPDPDLVFDRLSRRAQRKSSPLVRNTDGVWAGSPIHTVTTGKLASQSKPDLLHPF